jgi:hypothetical protein
MHLRSLLLAACALCACTPVKHADPTAAPVASMPAGASVAATGSERSAQVPAEKLAAADRGPARSALSIAGGELRVTFDAGRFDLSAAVLLGWVERCARAVSGYYGQFPVRHVQVVLHSVHGSGIHGGHTDADPEPLIDIEVGEHATSLELEQNWSLTHEMVHLALPNLRRSHHWLEEGLASYVEPIARARAHWLAEANVWREWHENLERGLPEAGDRGLDHTPTWGRTYWGGALFCLLADLEIRKRTDNRFELRDALRAILAAGGDMTAEWSIDRVFETGDLATHTHVLRELYQAHKDAPVSVDLEALWRELGVSERHGEIQYDDAAPSAAIRRTFVIGRS